MKCNTIVIKLKSGTFLRHLFLQMNKVVITRDGEDANYICNKLPRECIKWSSQMNYLKTEYMTKDLDELHIHGIKIKKTDNVTYQVFIINQDESSKMEIMKRVSTGIKKL